MLMDRARLDAALPAYQIGERIGRRGFGVVFAARHRRIGLQVAVKVLADGGIEDGQRERSLAEATALGELDHPHIVRIHDYVEHDGLCLLIMERLTGGSLEERSAFTPAEACGVGLAVADALAAAHQRGILHRDLKPENLLYSTDGTLKLVGFGFAKTFDGAASLISAASGTPAYMAPERIQGLQLGPATDLYSLGVMLYELLSGRLPFSRELPVAALLHQHLNVPAPLLTRVPPDLSAVVDRSLRKMPGQRQNSAYEFEMELAQATAKALGADWLEAVAAPLRVSGRVRDAARGQASAAPTVPVGPVGMGSPVGTGSPVGRARIPAAAAPSDYAAPTDYQERPAGALTTAPPEAVQALPRRSRHSSTGEAGEDPGFRASSPGGAVEAPPRPPRTGDRPPGGPDGVALPQSEGPPHQPWYRRRWVIAAIVGALVVGVTVVVIAPWNSGAGQTGQVNVASPRGLVVDAAGNLYLTDVANHQVRKIGADGTVTIVAGTGAIGSGGDGKPARDAQLSYPGSLALGAWGSVYIADTAEHRIRQVTRDGKIQTVVGATPTASTTDDRTDAQAVELPDSFSIGASPAGQLYIVESGSGVQRVLRLNANGVETVAGGTAGQSDYPGDGFGQLRSVAVGRDGRIYVADKSRRLIWVFTVGGVPTPFAGNGTAADCPSGIVAGGPETVALGASGELYVGSYGLCKLIKGSAQELLHGRYIDSVAVAPDGDVYFISQNQIYKRTSAGKVTLVTD